MQLASKQAVDQTKLTREKELVFFVRFERISYSHPTVDLKVYADSSPITKADEAVFSTDINSSLNKNNVTIEHTVFVDDIQYQVGYEIIKRSKLNERIRAYLLNYKENDFYPCVIYFGTDSLKEMLKKIFEDITPMITRLFDDNEIIG